MGAVAPPFFQENRVKSVLVTGASGLLGRSLTRHLAETGTRVFGLTHFHQEPQTSEIEYFSVDLSSDWSVTSLPPRVDAIVHLAQSASFRDFPMSALDVFSVNIESTAKLLDYARQVGVEKFIYASSGGVYGNGNQAFSENAPIVTPGKLGYYLGSKNCGEILVQSYASVFQVVVVRPFFMYGPGQNRSMLIPRLLDSVASGKPIGLQGHSGIRINPIHVSDASTAVAAALKLEDSATFNIAGPDVLTIREICENMGRYLDKTPIFESQCGEPCDLVADISLMKQRLHNPKHSLVDVIQEIAI